MTAYSASTVSANTSIINRNWHRKSFLNLLRSLYRGEFQQPARGRCEINLALFQVMMRISQAWVYADSDWKLGALLNFNGFCLLHRYIPSTAKTPPTYIENVRRSPKISAPSNTAVIGFSAIKTPDRVAPIF